MPQQNVEIVQRLIETWGRGDYSAALDSIDPEVEVNVALRTRLDGTYRGHAGLAEMLGAFWAEFEAQRIEIEEAMAAGRSLSLGCASMGEVSRSGLEIDEPAWHVWSLREGKAVRWRLFRTKQQALEAAGLSSRSEQIQATGSGKAATPRAALRVRDEENQSRRSVQPTVVPFYAVSCRCCAMGCRGCFPSISTMSSEQGAPQMRDRGKASPEEVRYEWASMAFAVSRKWRKAVISPSEPNS